MVHALGILPDRLVTLQVRGSRSGRLIRFPLAMTIVGGQRYLVSMLGNDAAWVRNVRLAHGRAVLLHGRVEEVRLELVDAAQRPPVLKAYLQIAPGARPHIPVDKDAPQEAFAAIAEGFPVFRVLSAETERR